eukprot:scaffold452_cov235-Pinguiococcus_pyrenoidosus.AAC.7
MKLAFLLLLTSSPAVAFRAAAPARRPASRLQALEPSLVHVGEAAAQLAQLPSLLLGDDGGSGAVQPASYSKTSYYTTLALYALSFPGLISQIRRSVKADPKVLSRRPSPVPPASGLTGGSSRPRPSRSPGPRPSRPRPWALRPRWPSTRPARRAFRRPR